MFWIQAPVPFVKSLSEMAASGPLNIFAAPEGIVLGHLGHNFGKKTSVSLFLA
jgi:hypothetical protein